jgi:hypothetical protein
MTAVNNSACFSLCYDIAGCIPMEEMKFILTQLCPAEEAAQICAVKIIKLYFRYFSEILYMIFRLFGKVSAEIMRNQNFKRI